MPLTQSAVMPVLADDRPTVSTNGAAIGANPLPKLAVPVAGDVINFAIHAEQHSPYAELAIST